TRRSLHHTGWQRRVNPSRSITSMKDGGRLSALGTSRPAPVSDRLRTVHRMPSLAYAIRAPFSTFRRGDPRLSVMTRSGSCDQNSLLRLRTAESDCRAAAACVQLAFTNPESAQPSTADLKSLTHSWRNRVQGLQIESGTRIMGLRVPMTFRSS